MDRRTVHLGPVSRELLTLQARHRLSRIWDGGLLRKKFHPDDFWELIRDNPLHHRTVAYLTRTDF